MIVDQSNNLEIGRGIGLDTPVQGHVEQIVENKGHSHRSSIHLASTKHCSVEPYDQGGFAPHGKHLARRSRSDFYRWSLAILHPDRVTAGARAGPADDSVATVENLYIGVMAIIRPATDLFRISKPRCVTLDQVDGSWAGCHPLVEGDEVVRRKSLGQSGRADIIGGVEGRYHRFELEQGTTEMDLIAGPGTEGNLLR